MRVALVLALLFVPPVMAADYYVDATDGDDGNTGTSPGQAWQTLAKIEAESFAANDNIYLQRGEVWEESLDFPSSGTSGNPITISAYGSGSPPVIDGGGTRTHCLRLDNDDYVDVEYLECRDYTERGIHGSSLNGNSIRFVFLHTSSPPSSVDQVGIYCLSCGSVEVEHVTLLASGYYGMHYPGGSGNTLKNSIVAGHRYWGINGGVTVSYSAVWGNGLLQGGTLSIREDNGVSDGGGNLGQTARLHFRSLPYPGRVGWVFDDILPGNFATWDAWGDQLEARNVRGTFAAISGSFDGDGTGTDRLNTHAVDHDVIQHTWSGRTYTNLDGMDIQYVGAGSACTLTISGSTLTTTVTGGPGGEDLSIDLTDPNREWITELAGHIDGFAAYTASDAQPVSGRAFSDTLADVADEDIATAEVTLQHSKERLMRSEVGDAYSWMTTNTPNADGRYLVWTGNANDSDTRAWADDEGLLGARGLGFGSSGDGNDEHLGVGVNVFDQSGVNGNGSGGSEWHGSSQQTKNDIMAMVGLTARVWGLIPLPYTHPVDGYTEAEIGDWVDAVQDEGLTWTTLMEATRLLRRGTLVDTYQYTEAPGPWDITPAPDSDAIDAGTDLGYSTDIYGNAIVSAPDIGAAESQQETHARGVSLRGASIR